MQDAQRLWAQNDCTHSSIARQAGGRVVKQETQEAYASTALGYTQYPCTETSGGQMVIPIELARGSSQPGIRDLPAAAWCWLRSTSLFHDALLVIYVLWYNWTLVYGSASSPMRGPVHVSTHIVCFNDDR